MMEIGVRSLTTDRVRTGTWPVVSFHRRSMDEGEIRMTETCTTSSGAAMRVAGSKTGAKSESALSMSGVMRGTMITMAPSMINLTNNAPLKEGIMQEGLKPFSHNLKRVRWPLNFKPSKIRKYDGFTNPTEWLEAYQLSIKATGGDSYIKANYLPVHLSSSARMWLLGLPSGYVHSWSDLCRLFTSNILATCACLGVDWDLASVVQKKGE
jgi:hypothetical protein